MAKDIDNLVKRMGSANIFLTKNMREMRGQPPRRLLARKLAMSGGIEDIVVVYVSPYAKRGMTKKKAGQLVLAYSGLGDEGVEYIVSTEDEKIVGALNECGAKTVLSIDFDGNGKGAGLVIENWRLVKAPKLKNSAEVFAIASKIWESNGGQNIRGKKKTELPLAPNTQLTLDMMYERFGRMVENVTLGKVTIPEELDENTLYQVRAMTLTYPMLDAAYVSGSLDHEAAHDVSFVKDCHDIWVERRPETGSVIEFAKYSAVLSLSDLDDAKEIAEEFGVTSSIEALEEGVPVKDILA